MDSYRCALEAALNEHSEVQCCLTECVECGIPFLTFPCNKNRKDLRCPFGCRDKHRRQQSTERSTTYYSTASGKIKKAIQNCKRSRSSPVSDVELGIKVPDKNTAEEIIPVTEEIITHVTTVITILEGGRVSREEIILLIMSILRQHRLGLGGRIDYVVMQADKMPP